MTHIQWTNQRVLITGGSAGLGLALARELNKRGAHVAVVGRSAKRLDEAFGLAQNNNKESSIATIVGDIAHKEDIYRISGEAQAILGGVDVLINNASYLGQTPLRLLVDSDCEDLERAFVTNVLGVFRLTKALVGGMLLSRSGVVVNITSDASKSAYPHWGAYGVSKAALDHLTAIFHAELGSHGVRFLAVDPGDMDTDMHARAIPDADPHSLYRPADVAADLANFFGKVVPADQTRFGASQWRGYL